MSGKRRAGERDGLLVNRRGDERGALAGFDRAQRGVDRVERDASVRRVDDAVADRTFAADVDEIDVVRRIRERAAAEDARGDVDIAQRLEDDLRADAGRIAEGDGQRFHGGDCSASSSELQRERSAQECRPMIRSATLRG